MEQKRSLEAVAKEIARLNPKPLGGLAKQDNAALVIQTAFRGYLVIKGTVLAYSAHAQQHS